MYSHMIDPRIEMTDSITENHTYMHTHTHTHKHEDKYESMERRMRVEGYVFRKEEKYLHYFLATVIN